MDIIRFYLLVLVFAVSACWDLDASETATRIITVSEAPSSFINASKRIDGYSTHVVQAIQFQIQDRTAIELVPEARALKLPTNTPNIILYGISRTSSREKNYRWVGKLLEKSWVVYGLKVNNLRIDSLSSLQDLNIVGVVRGDIREEWLRLNGLTNLFSSNSHMQNLKLLLKGRIDAFLYEQAGFNYMLKNMPTEKEEITPLYTVNRSDVWIVMSKSSNNRLFNLWTQGYQKIRKEGQLESIANHWQLKLEASMDIKSKVENQVLVF